VFLSSRPAAEGLVTEVLEKRIETADLTAAHRTRLLKVLDGRKRASIQEFFAETLPEDRREIVQRYQSSLKLKGDPLQGRQLFQKNCAVCHRIGKIGVNVAPDISDSRTKTPAQLLDSILDPNRAVDANYFGYSLITSTGRIFSGIISAETANSVTLKQAEGRTMTVLRSEIAELHNTGVSLMPTGQEKNITERQMADLISFIKNWRYLDGQTPLRTDP
jgi:putative heme-binding domain-containing protein